MPRKPWKVRPVNVTVPEKFRHYFETGESEPGDVDLFRLSGHPDRLRETWRKVRREVMTSWVKSHPGSRPWCWWECDAPQSPVPGWPGFDAAQRKRLGGVGQAPHEVSCSWAGYSFGIPNGWLDEQGAKLLGGIAVDAADPPTFESQAAFLRRHNLLSAAEIKYLEGHLELMSPERLTFDDDDEQASNSRAADSNSQSAKRSDC